MTASFGQRARSRQFFCRGSHGQMNGFPLLLRQPERAGKELLLLGAKKLLWGQFVLAGIGAPKKSKVEHHYVLFVRIDARL
jgi:hypothetical protein